MDHVFEIGAGVRCHLGKLVTTRLGVIANSGAGKTFAVRRILEQTAGQIQQLVIDPEGEYHTLRERYDYVLAAPSGGDTVAHPRTAALLAERLLELGASAILDIYELNPADRKAFVAAFVQALVDAPRHLWHPALVVIDEAHVYAPEGTETESGKAVHALASRGRKRGFCMVLATQRLAMLSKTAAAECNNLLVGRVRLDVDLKRAGEMLGLSQGERVRTLPQLDPGTFYVLGPAMELAGGDTPIVKVGPVHTTHAAAGTQAAPVPPPTATIRALLPKLSDLPQEAAARTATVEDLRAQVDQLAAELAMAKANARVVEVEKPVLTPDVREWLAAMLTGTQEKIDALRDTLTTIRLRVDDALEPCAPPPREDPPMPPPMPPPMRQPQRSPAAGTALEPRRQKILNAVAYLASIGVCPASRIQVAMMCGRPSSSGSYKNDLGALRSDGFIDYPHDGAVALTGHGTSAASVEGVPHTSRELWQQLQGLLEPRRWQILDALLRVHPEVVRRDILAGRCNRPSSSGSFKNDLGALRTLGLVDYPRDGYVGLTDVMFLGRRG